MLNVQKYLQSGKTLEDLNKDYGIKNNPHPEDGRVILNYDQIDSSKHKLEPIVRECRGLVLDRFDNWKLVTRGFYRFFNFGENAEDTAKFDWPTCAATDKEDGSYIILYWYKDKFHLNTRNSFGHGVCNEMSGLTWREVFMLASPSGLFNNLDSNIQYAFELCSPYNQVVRRYYKPTSFLLTTFVGEVENPDYETYSIAEKLGVNLPEYYEIFESKSDFDTVQAIIDKHVQDDPTFEGLVLRDRNNHRLKCKSLKYVTLHKAVNNNNVTQDALLKLIIDGEDSEFCSYFPLYKSICSDMTNKLTQLHQTMDVVWDGLKHITNKKDFAEIAVRYRFSHYLFESYKNNVSPSVNSVKNPKKLVTLL